jgi:hypothetical protein
VTIAALDSSEVQPDPLRDADRRPLAWNISWGGVELKKPAMLKADYSAVGASVSPVLYHFTPESTWRRIGGSLDTGRISAPIHEEGSYALFSDDSVPAGARTLSALQLTPRAFSPSGSFASQRVAISFELGQGSLVTVRVYNAAGRLVRQLVSGEPFGAGANVVRWDGRDFDGGIATPGIYLVSVHALGERRTAAVAVVR